MRFKESRLIKKSDINMNIIDNKNPFIYAAFAVIGVCVGVVCETLNCEVYTTLSGYYVSYLDLLENQSFFKTLFYYAENNVLFIIAAMLLGVCAAGYQILFLIPLVKGLGVGSVCSFLYSALGIKGVLYCLILVFPASVIELIAIIIACSNSTRMSCNILSLLNKNKIENEETELNFFILRYLIILFIVIIASGLYSIMTILFEKIII